METKSDTRMRGRHGKLEESHEVRNLLESFLFYPKKGQIMGNDDANGTKGEQ